MTGVPTRTSGRPRHHRLLRAGRWVLAPVIGLLLVVQCTVVVARNADDAAPLAVADAVEQFRTTRAQAQTSTTPTSLPGAGAPTAAPADASADPSPNETPTSTVAAVPTAADPAGPQPSLAGATPSEERPLPAAGVYSYRTEGYEEVDALGGQRHDYPAETTVTYTPEECGFRERWAPLQDRYDERMVCPGPGGDEARWFESQRAFFGRSDTRRLICDPASLARPVPAEVGARWSFRCVDDRTDARSEGTVVDIAPFDVGGTSVPAVHLRISSVVSGDNATTSELDIWVHAENGLVLRRTSVLDGRSPSPGGDVSYTERYTIELLSLTPRT